MYQRLPIMLALVSILVSPLENQSFATQEKSPSARPSQANAPETSNEPRIFLQCDLM